MEENNQTAAIATSAAAVVTMTVEPLMPTLSPRDKTLASVTTTTMRVDVASIVLKQNTAPEEEAQEAAENNNAEEENSGAENKNHMKSGVDDDSNNNNNALNQTEGEEDEHTDSDSADTEKEEEEDDDEGEGEDEAQGHVVVAASDELTHAHETSIPSVNAVEEKESLIETAESSPPASETQPVEEGEETHADESEEKQAVEENDSSASGASDGSEEPAQANESESSREHTESEDQDDQEEEEQDEEEQAEETTNDSEGAVGVELCAGSILDPSVFHPTPAEEQLAEEDEYGGLELRIDIPIDEDSSLHHHHHHHHHHHNGSAIDLDLDLDSDGDSDSDSDDDNDEHEPLDKSTSTTTTTSSHSHSHTSNGSLPSVPLTITYPVNEMEVVTNRGGRSGSLSKFLDDADLYRRRSLTSYNDGGFHEKKLTLSAFLDMAIDPILEVLDDADSDVRLWLLQSETVEDVLKEFVKPPVFTGEPHDEYGFYKNYFICSEIIMKLYTGEDDLYESFSSDSSSGSASANTVFGCQEAVDLQKWELLYSIFQNEAPLDEMQLLFFSKALVRLHDGFCLEDGYVSNVLRRFLPCVMPHLYSNTIKYMLTLILQSYESVHPITGRNDAMEIVVPLLAQATRLDAQDALNPAAVENASHLLVDMLKANQADRLGAFCRREGGVYLSKYFVRDQFGTIRGFESMTHGYHNFLQFMFLEELGKWPAIVEQIFDNALFELSEIQQKKIHQVSGCLNVQVATELLLLFKKHGEASASSTTEDESASSSPSASAADISPVNGNPYSDSYPGSPRQSGLDTSMYNLRSLSRSDALWSTILRVATSTAERFCGFLTAPLPSSVEIALAKHLHALVHVHSAELDLELHKGGLMQKYLASLELRPTFDMLLIHIVPAIAFIIKDAECTRARDNWLTLDLFDEVDGASSLPQLLVRADDDIPQLKIYAGLLKDVVDEVLTTKSPTQNNITLQRMCKRCPPWGSPRYSRRSSSSPKLSRQSSTSAASSSASAPSSAASSPQQPAASSPVLPEAVSAASPVEVPSSSTLHPSREEEDQATTAAAAAASPSSVEQQKQEQHAESPPRTSAIRRLSSRKLSRSSSQRNSEKLTPDQLPATPTTATTTTTSATVTATSATATAASSSSSSSPVDGEPSEPEPSGKKSTHYIKQMLQTPVFRGTMRLGSVIKPPEKSPRNSDLDSSASGTAGSAGNQPSQRGSFGWNSVLKRLRKSFVTTGHGGDKGEKKLLAIANEPYVPPSGGQAAQAEVLVVDMAKGEDVSKLVHRDGGVHVQDVLASAKASAHSSDKPANTITSGYVYKSKFPETGQRNLWERYYFVLNRQDGLLSYYVSESHAKDRTYLRGTARPVSVTEGIPVSANGQHSVYGFQINTQGHGAFMVVVDSIDTRLVWLSEIVACVAMLTPQVPQKRLSLVGDESAAAQAKLLANGGKSWSKQQLRELVVEYYKNLFGPSLRFATPMDAPASFWMEEKIDPVAESCVLSSNLPDCVPYWGEFHGYSRLCDFWKIRDETLERSSGRVLRIVVDEDEETAVVMTSTTYRILRNSQTVTEESCDIVNMSGGAIISIHCTFDSFRIAEAFRKGDSPLLPASCFLPPSATPYLLSSPLLFSRSTSQLHEAMSELQLIVEQLNKEPFRLGLTLVAFDEKTNFELLQILNEVFTEIDAKHNVDLRNEPDEARAFRYVEFLQLLKFPLPRDVDAFKDALIHGDRHVLYPILHWALKSVAAHKKRAYLGKFLAPLNVPQEFFGNESLTNMHDHYKQLQDQFKMIHKEVDQLRNSKTRPGELRKEITQLDEESHQLQEKIANLKKKTASESGFKEILEATSALRKEQEEQAKLAERKRDQMMALSLVDKRARECEQRLMDLRASLAHDTPPEQLFEHLRTQVDRNRDILQAKFPAEFKAQQENLQKLERALSEPPKTEADIADMEDEILSLKRAIQQCQAQVAEASQKQGGGGGATDDKLAIFRQHATVQAKKLADKEDELDAVRSEKAKLQKQIDELENKMASLAGPKFMGKKEFGQYANTVRNKTIQYKKVKGELAAISAESVVLHRTEQLLKSKLSDLDGFLKDLEAKKGVSGFLDTQDKLDHVSEMNAQVNKLKGETLEEISRIVTDINQTLKERKNQLAPQIKELRAVRQRYQEMEQTYLEKKAQYDNTAVGLETERIKLEQECHAFQEDCVREESQFHLLHCFMDMEKAKIDKVQQEMEFEKGGTTRLLRDIKSFQELYKHKVAQQESLTKELRKQQKTLKSNTADHNAQREMFESLFALLQCKVKLTQGGGGGLGGMGGGLGGAGGLGGGGMGGAGGLGGLGGGFAGDGSLFDGHHADIAQFDVGGANVMTLDA